MIVPMKKVSLIILGDKREDALKKLRKLGLVHIEITEGTGEKLSQLKDQVDLLEKAIYALSERSKKNTAAVSITADKSLTLAEEIDALADEKKAYEAEQIALNSELSRLKSWGEVDPKEIKALSEKGVEVLLYDMPKTDFDGLGENVKALVLQKTKASVKCLIIRSGIEGESEIIESLNSYKVELPKISTAEIRQKIDANRQKIDEIEGKIASYSGYIQGMKAAVKSLEKEIEFETFATGMENEELSAKGNVSVAYFGGYIEAENIENLKQAAHENSWGLLIDDPTPDDNVPTKLKNNRFVSLIYP